MTFKVKLLTLWSGPLPDWIDRFTARIRANTLIHWDLIDTADLAAVNRLASDVSGVPCCKTTPYSLCDLRPLFGHMFHDRYAGYDWWGWCDLDVVLGDLDALLPPLLSQYDVISAEGHATSGSLTILLNTPDVCALYRQADFAEVLADPDYCNFDENGFAPAGMTNDNPSFTRTVKSSGLRYRFDDRSWTETQDPLPDGVPSRTCRFVGKRLMEIPTNRQLLLYHFTHTQKEWPIPNRYASHIGAQLDRSRMLPLPDVITPEESPAYWSQRLARVQEDCRPLYLASLDTTPEDWDELQAHTAEVLAGYVRVGESVLDAGCGIGSLVEVLPHGVTYLGVDYCQDMVDLARQQYPNHSFFVADLAELPLPDDFAEWFVCRNVEGSTRTLLSNKRWRQMQAEMLRVARRGVILIDASRNVRVVERPAARGEAL